MSQSDAWFYLAGSESKGPFSREQIAALASEGVIDSRTQVWSEASGWRTLADTDLLRAPGSGQTGRSSVPLVTSRPEVGPRSVGFIEATRLFFSNYATFSGRSSRSEYWYALLFVVLSSIVAGLLDAALFGTSGHIDPISSIWQLALLIPGISVAVRRLHDTDRSGWNYLWLFLPVIGAIILIVFFCQRSSPGRNRYG
ncbi:DUF805 domain-containing protein [Hansschlegelia beijingensis]|uniref:DUF805 domain-containing protein n=1 Tax=Hansschlegelia beijingensis TaxID=1133344 RepID=UPI003809FF22